MNDSSYYYNILGLYPGATKKEIKIAFRELSKIHHPDKGGKPEIYVEIKNAYQYLMNYQEMSTETQIKDLSLDRTFLKQLVILIQLLINFLLGVYRT